MNPNSSLWSMRIRFILLCGGCTVIGASALFGQVISMVGAGYAPTNIRVSPGQITTIFVAGLKPDFSKPQTATTLPLPSSLAGISVTISRPFLKQSFVVPLLSIGQSITCGSSVLAPTPLQVTLIPIVPSDCLLTAITLQIPYELAVVGDFIAPTVQVSASAELVIAANGVTSKPFAISVVVDNLHVLTTCYTKQ